jgi:hypothetical protein
MNIREKSSKIDWFFALIKIGSGRILMLFDLVVWSLIVVDLYHIRALDLDVFHSWAFRRVWELFGLKHVGIAALIFFLPPILSAFVNFLARNIEVLRETITSKRRQVILGLHFLTSFIFAIFVAAAPELQLLSGYKAESVTWYESSSAEFIAWLLGSSALAVGGAAALARLLGKTNVTELKLWFRLSDSSSEFFPRQRANLVFVNTASMAPPIEWIGKKEETYRYEYQRRVPTSEDAKDYLLKAAERSRDLIREYLFSEKIDRANFSIEFLPLTSRGLEVGLTHIPNLTKIVISPYEHPSQKRVIEWFKTIHPDVKSESIDMDYSILQKGWNEQRVWLVESLRAAIKLDTEGGKVAILISEVHYLTGLVLNITEVIAALRTGGENSNLVFMVDGSQSVGNLENPFNDLGSYLRDQDFYYFSAHKWLLSPNTCGVLITRKHADRYKVRPYDLFGTELPSSTIDPGVIFGIKSSLEYLIEKGKFHLRTFQEKSSSLKAYFIEEIGEQFEVIQSASHEMNRSNFVAVRPRNGYRWRDPSVAAFWVKIRSDGVDLTVDKLDEREPSMWWLRISFPYFLQLHLLKRLIKHLQSRVTSIN